MAALGHERRFRDVRVMSATASTAAEKRTMSGHLFSKTTFDDIIVRRPICLCPPEPAYRKTLVSSSGSTQRRKHENPADWLERVGSGDGFHPAGTEPEQCTPDDGKRSGLPPRDARTLELGTMG